MKTAFLGITAAGIALACLAAPLAAQTAARQENSMDVVPVLTVSGSGQARVAPDEANVRLGVLAQAPTARAAQDKVNRSADAVLEAIRKLGVPAGADPDLRPLAPPDYAQGRPDGRPGAADRRLSGLQHRDRPPRRPRQGGAGHRRRARGRGQQPGRGGVRPAATTARPARRRSPRPWASRRGPRPRRWPGRSRCGWSRSWRWRKGASRSAPPFRGGRGHGHGVAMADTPVSAGQVGGGRQRHACAGGSRPARGTSPARERRVRPSRRGGGRASSASPPIPEGGFYRETFRSPGAGLPGAAPRRPSTTCCREGRSRPGTGWTPTRSGTTTPEPRWS